MNRSRRSSLSTIVFFSAILASSLSWSAATSNTDIPQVKDVTIGVSDAFVPGGFDSEADAYVVVSGMFPNGCYKWKEAQVQHNSDQQHDIRSVASVSQGMCMMVMIPFQEEVRLGKLSPGTHQLRFLSGDGTYLQKTLTVEE